MASIEDFVTALDRAGLAPFLIEEPGQPLHIAVPFPGRSVQDEPVLRINRLDSVEEEIELWQIVVIFPAQAASELSYNLTEAMLNTVNAALTVGKVVAVPDKQMVYFTHAHITDTGASVTRSGPAVVALILESLTVLSPAICETLETELAEDAPDLETLTARLEEAEGSLKDLLEVLQQNEG